MPITLPNGALLYSKEEVPQRSAEWFKIRELKLTGSEATAIASAGAGLETLVTKLVMEYFSSQANEKFTEKFSNSFMSCGVEFEDQARTVYELVNGVTVTEVGFIKYNDYVGSSPDGLVEEDGMTEYKCHGDKKFFELQKKLAETDDPVSVIDKSYYNQIQQQLQNSGRKWCDYFGYNPNFNPSYIQIRVSPDKLFHKKLEAGYAIGEEKIKALVAKMSKVLEPLEKVVPEEPKETVEAVKEVETTPFD